MGIVGIIMKSWRQNVWQMGIMGYMGFAMELLICGKLRLQEKLDDLRGPRGQGSIEKRSYFFEDAQQHISYGLLVPETYDGSEAAPLVVLLHGMLSSPHEIIRLRGIADEARKRGYIIVAPDGYGSSSWYGIKGSGLVPDHRSELSEKDVLNVLNIVRTEFNIDSRRIYLMGHSMGGAGAMHLGAVHAGIWAAIAPLSPPIFCTPPEALEHMPVMVVTGESDWITKVAPIRAWVDKAQGSGMKCVYEEIQGGSHLFVVNNPDVYTKVFDFFDVHIKAQH